MTDDDNPLDLLRDLRQLPPPEPAEEFDDAPEEGERQTKEPPRAAR
jgi:hypothetical protein